MAIGDHNLCWQSKKVTFTFSGQKILLPAECCMPQTKPVIAVQKASSVDKINCLQRYPTTLPHITAVMLVVHGFNNRPAIMLPLIKWFNGNGSEVWLVCLTGHRDTAMDPAAITTQVWKEEMLTGYREARKTADLHKVPLYFLGYSLGALLGQTMLVLPAKKAPFDKQVLLAPAVALRRRVVLLRLFCAVGRPASLPSLTPEAYRVNAMLPLQAYRVLFGEEAKLQSVANSQLNLPTLVILDPKDELISASKLRQWIHRSALSNYRVVYLNDSLTGRQTRFHHLLVDEQTMGKENWALATAEMKQFLFGE